MNATHLFAATVMSGLIAMPAFAQATGDAAAGEKAFRQCQACHVVVNDAGETLAGKAGKTGPNLFHAPGGAAGAVEDFRYSKSMTEAGENGLVWDEASFVAYVQDPTGFLKTYLDDSSARGSMSFKVRKEQDALDLYAYLTSLQ